MLNRIEIQVAADEDRSLPAAPGIEIEMAVGIRRAHLAFVMAIHRYAEIAIAVHGQGRLPERHNLPRLGFHRYRANDAANAIPAAPGIIRHGKSHGMRLGGGMILDGDLDFGVTVVGVTGVDGGGGNRDLAELFGFNASSSEQR